MIAAAHEQHCVDALLQSYGIIASDVRFGTHDLAVEAVRAVLAASGMDELRKAMTQTQLGLNVLVAMLRAANLPLFLQATEGLVVDLRTALAKSGGA